MVNCVAVEQSPVVQQCNTMPSSNIRSLCLQGSDIETLGSEAAVEYGAELLEHPPVEEAELQDTQASAPGGKHHHADLMILIMFIRVTS